jgi:hypothetical protein
MSNLTQERNTPQYGIDVIPQLAYYPAAAAAVLYQGGLAVLKAGVAERGQTATGLVALGRIEKTVDNSAGAAGAKSVQIRQGVFKFANSAAADAIAAADIGTDCFIVDDQTVAKTNGTATRSRAGKVVGVEPDGVWVLIAIGL